MTEELFMRIQKEFKMGYIKEWEGTTDRIREYAQEVAVFLEKNKDEKLIENSMVEFQNGIMTAASREFMEHYFGVLVLNMVYYYGERGLLNDDLLSVGIMVVHNVLNENKPNDGMIYMASKIEEAYKTGFKRNFAPFGCPPELKDLSGKVTVFVEDYMKKNGTIPGIHDICKNFGKNPNQISLVLASCKDFTLGQFNNEKIAKFSSEVRDCRTQNYNPVPEACKLIGRREQIALVMLRYGGLESPILSVEEVCEMLDVSEKYVEAVDRKTAHYYFNFGKKDKGENK